MNAFRPRCKCMSGYKSNNPNSDTILTSNIDICIRCTSVAECGEAPTFLPTIAPTLSTKPSSRPTQSSIPSERPTMTNTPTASPTTSAPTIKPTLSRVPSHPPTSSPTMIDSVFDGDPCKFDIECKSGLCVQFRCVPKKVSYNLDCGRNVILARLGTQTLLLHTP